MDEDRKIAAFRAAARRELNRSILERVHGVPAQKGTPLTDMDPRNPNRPPAANDNARAE